MPQGTSADQPASQGWECQERLERRVEFWQLWALAKEMTKLEDWKKFSLQTRKLGPSEGMGLTPGHTELVSEQRSGPPFQSFEYLRMARRAASEGRCPGLCEIGPPLFGKFRHHPF